MTPQKRAFERQLAAWLSTLHDKSIRPQQMGQLLFSKAVVFRAEGDDALEETAWVCPLTLLRRGRTLWIRASRRPCASATACFHRKSVGLETSNASFVAAIPCVFQKSNAFARLRTSVSFLICRKRIVRSHMNNHPFVPLNTLKIRMAPYFYGVSNVSELMQLSRFFEN